MGINIYIFFINLSKKLIINFRFNIMIINILLIIILVIVVIYLCYKAMNQFWSRQPVFHFHNLKYWLFPPGIIQKKLPQKTIENEGGIAPYFTEFIRRELEKIDEELDINLYKDGLIIHTTLDSRVQESLSNAFRLGIQKNQIKLNKELITNPKKIENAIKHTNFNLDTAISILSENDTIPKMLRNQLLVQGAGIVLDPTNGHILGMIGGREENIYIDHFNRATQAKRQPGSIFKPFIYLAALRYP